MIFFINRCQEEGAGFAGWGADQEVRGMQWSEGGDHRPAGPGGGSTEAAQNRKYRLDTGIIYTEAAQNP